MTPAETFAAAELIELAFDEDLGDPGVDVSSRVSIPFEQQGTVQLVARREGVVAGMPVLELLFHRLDEHVVVTPRVNDGAAVEAGEVVAGLAGPMRSLLAGERTALNLLSHLSGIASLTRRFVEAVAGTEGQILDTRKTLPGYRLLAKYAVRLGGGTNHRLGLHDGCLIKDNHLAAWRRAHPGRPLSELIAAARDQLGSMPLEVEVDDLDQLAECLAGRADLVLLDNMPPETLRQAVALRNRENPSVLLEASGGVRLETVRQIAETGVDRISVGALTHSAPHFDLGFDWLDEQRHSRRSGTKGTRWASE